MQLRMFQSVWWQLCKKRISFCGTVAFSQVSAGVDGLPGVAGALEFGDAEICFKPVMRGKRTFQAMLAFHFDQLGDIRSVKSHAGFQFPENLQECLPVQLFQRRCDAISQENRPLTLLCDVFGAFQVRDTLRFLLCQQCSDSRLLLRLGLSLSFELLQLQPPRLFLGTPGLGFRFSNQRDTTFPFDCGGLLVLRPGNITFHQPCKRMQPIVVQVGDFFFGARFVFRACFEDLVKLRASYNGYIQIINQVSSCQLK